MFWLKRRRPHSFYLRTALLALVTLLMMLGAPPRPGAAESGPPWRSWGGRIGPVAADAAGPAFLAWGTRIERIADPAAPLALREGPILPEVVQGLAVGHGLLAATSRAPSGAASAQLRLWSLTDGREPVFLGKVIDLPGKEVGAVGIGYARAVVLTARGITVLRLKDPEAPTLEAEIAARAPAGARAWDGRIALAGGRAWLARPWGLESLDLSRLESAPPSQAIRRLDGAATRDVATSGERVFALRADGRLTVLEAASGLVLAELMVSDQPLAVAAHGERLAVLDQGGRRLRWFNTMEDRPVWQRDEILLPQGSIRGRLVLRDSGALLALEAAGLLRMASPDAAVEALPLLSMPRQVWPEPARVWVAAGTAGLWTLEAAADSPSPAIRGTLLLAGPTGLHLADASMPSIERPVDIQAVAVRGSAVYLLTARDGLVVLRREGSEALRITGHLPGVSVLQGATGLMLSDRRLIGLSVGGGVWTVDVTDDDQPRLLGVSSDQGILDLAPLGDDRLVFVGMGALGQGRFGEAAVPLTGAVIPPADWLDLEAVFSRVAIAGEGAVLSGASEGIALVDVDAAAGPHQTRRIPGGVSGRAGVLGDLLQLTEEQGLSYLLRIGGGGLRPLGRVALPAPGLDGGGGHDVIGAGAALFLPRGQAGVLRLAATADIPAATRATTLFLPILAAREDLPAKGCVRADAWLLLLDDRLLGRGPATREAALLEGVTSMVLDLRRDGLRVHRGRYGSQAELLAADVTPWPEPDPALSAQTGRADLGLAIGLRLLEDAAMGASGRLGVVLTVAGRVDEGSQRLMEHQAMLLDARGVPVVRLDLDGDGIAATGRSSALPSAAQAAARRGDWEGLARQLAQNCW